MTNQVIAAVAAAVVSAVLGYMLGVRIKGRHARYRAAFVGIVLGTVVVLAVAFFRSDTLMALVALGCGFGLLNGVRHGYKRPFEGLTPDTRDASQD